ncbi:MAG TPA: hypothetical protein VHG89_02325 [Verrucomicrobiae bacterium]|nr:hypothetical protein [Verrucomicrobiae bacterium]
MNDITLQLDRLERLFAESPFDLTQPELPAGPAIENVVKQLRSRSLRSTAPRIVVRLTAQKVTPELQASGAKALRIYCKQQANAHHETARGIRHGGWRALRLGLILLALASSLSALFDHFQPLPAVLNRLFSEGFLIVGWVVLWHPLETLLYDWIAPQRTARAYELLSRSELVLVGE